jgi:hypothetical protein
MQKSLVWTVVLSELTHVFCCVLPTLFSVTSLLVGLGVVASMPVSMLEIHHFMHHWEIPIIAGSGVILALAWLATWYSHKLECAHAHDCGHEACSAPKKSDKRTTAILKVATALFLFNVVVYAVVHRSEWFSHSSDLMHHIEAETEITE